MEIAGDHQEKSQAALPVPEFTWVLKEDFRTTEDDVRKVFGDCVSGRPEGVEFTDLDGDRKTVVFVPPAEV